MAKKMYLVDDHRKTLRVFEILTEVALVAALGLLVAKTFFFSYQTESRSMEPTISPNSFVFVNKMAYSFTRVERFDVVTFARNESNTDTLLSRHVIGLPNETVRIEKGVVFINGEKLDISAYFSEITSDGIAREGIRLKEDEYFVLGDTPADSEDSRSSTIGVVRFSKIIGKAWLNALSVTELSIIR